MLKYVAVLILSVTLFVKSAASQSTVLVDAPQVQRKGAMPSDAFNHDLSGDPQQQMQRAMIARSIAERQAQLRSDTEQLVALTAELKRHVDKAGANILSMDVIKKAQEIQKLAKSVQDKMKNAY
ncbi:MAG TPA: hypothetical protein VKH18_14785 [Terriglobales bacterium]|nr:hypothetical protein [Terriglobales bacterium]